MNYPRFVFPEGGAYEIFQSTNSYNLSTKKKGGGNASGDIKLLELPSYRRENLLAGELGRKTNPAFQPANRNF